MSFIGWFSIFLGTLWVVWPQLLRGWATRKASRVIFWLMFFSFFFPLAAWVGQWAAHGWLIVLVAFFVLGTLLQKEIGKLAERVPLQYFRIAGIVNIASGLSLIFLRK